MSGTEIDYAETTPSEEDILDEEEFAYEDETEVEATDEEEELQSEGTTDAIGENSETAELPPEEDAAARDPLFAEEEQSSDADNDTVDGDLDPSHEEDAGVEDLEENEIQEEDAEGDDTADQDTTSQSSTSAMGSLVGTLASVISKISDTLMGSSNTHTETPKEVTLMVTNEDDAENGDGMDENEDVEDENEDIKDEEEVIKDEKEDISRDIPEDEGIPQEEHPGLAAVSAIRSAILAMASDRSIRDSVAALASTEAVKDSILALASEVAIEDDIIVTSPSTQARSLSKMSVEKSREVVSRLSNQHERVSQNIEPSNLMSVESVTESELSMIPPAEPRSGSWVEGEFDPPPEQNPRATLTKVEKLSVSQSNSYKQSQDIQDLEEFAKLLEESTRHQPPRQSFDPLGMSQQVIKEGSKVSPLMVGTKSQVSGKPPLPVKSGSSKLLASTKSSSSSSSSSSPSSSSPSAKSTPSIVGSTSTVMVFGDRSVAPEEVATDGNVYNWLRHISGEEVAVHPSTSEPIQKKPAKKSSKAQYKAEKAAREKTDKADKEDKDRKEGEKPESEDEEEPRDPCGKCGCCKGMQKRLGLSVDEKRLTKGTGDAEAPEVSSITSSILDDLARGSSACETESDPCINDSSMRNPREWLRRATDEFMRRDCIRQVVLKHNSQMQDCRRTKVTRISRGPNPSFSDCVVSARRAHVPETEQIQLQINKGEDAVDYMMRVPKPCSRLSPRGDKCSRHRRYFDTGSTNMDICSRGDAISMRRQSKSRDRGRNCKLQKRSKSRDFCKKKRSKSRPPLARSAGFVSKKDDLLRTARNSAPLGQSRQFGGNWLSADLEDYGCSKRRRSPKRNSISPGRSARFVGSFIDWCRAGKPGAI